MTTEHKTKSLGQAIDEIIAALSAVPDAVRQVAIKAACDHLSIPIPNPQAATGEAAAAIGTRSLSQLIPLGEPDQVVDIRTLRQQKNPSTANEMACLVAFYLQRRAPAHERKNTVTAEDLNRYFIQANFPLPKRIEQLLVNSKAAGYFDSEGRGAYRLNAVGHNLVAHSLPRGDSPTQAKARRSSRVRKANTSATQKRKPARE